MSLTKNVHKSISQIEVEIESAKKLVKVGGTFVHFKDSNSRIKVIGFGTAEKDGELCVLYQNIDNNNVTFIRPLKSWLEKINVEGEFVERFKLID